MNTIDNIISLDPAAPALEKSRKRFVRSLEYEVIASLAKKQFTSGEVVLFDRLLQIPLAERIPGLIKEYGLQRAHRLLKMVLQEFCYSIPLPKSAKLSETKISVCACDLILAAYEDQLSLEDIVVFLEGAKDGRYGKFKGMLTHYAIMQKLEQFRQARTDRYFEIKEAQEAAVKNLSVIPRIGDTRSIGEILQGGEVISMNKRMSG